MRAPVSVPIVEPAQPRARASPATSVTTVVLPFVPVTPTRSRPVSGWPTIDALASASRPRSRDDGTSTTGAPTPSGAVGHDAHRAARHGVGRERAPARRGAGHGEEQRARPALAAVDLDVGDLDAAGGRVEREVLEEVAELHHVTSDEIEAAAPVSGLTIVPVEAMP